LGIVYRFQQFWTAWTATPSAKDLDRVRETLSPALMDLFLEMQPSEQAHSLRVFTEMREMGEKSPHLLAAALLHDVGKSSFQLSPWERALIVLFCKMAPHLVEQWGHAEPIGWKKPFVVYTCHPDWGARMVNEAGGDPLTVSLIRRHQDPIRESQQTIEAEYLRRLQRFDDES
jgi:hypothetical protein